MFQRFVVDDKPPKVRFTRLRLDDIASPEFRFAYDRWQRERGGRRAPARADFQPTDMPPVLPRLILIGVVRDPLIFAIAWQGRKPSSSMAWN